MALSITNLKKGVVFQWEGEPFRVVDYNQKVMGRGGSIVNVRIKSLLDGKVLEKTFKGNEQLETADVSTQGVQYLYTDGTNFFFMNDETFNQFEVAGDLVGDAAGYMKEGDAVTLQFFNDQPINVELPKMRSRATPAPLSPKRLRWRPALLYVCQPSSSRTI
jgi:elongation factor P